MNDKKSPHSGRANQTAEFILAQRTPESLRKGGLHTQHLKGNHKTKFVHDCNHCAETPAQEK